MLSLKISRLRELFNKSFTEKRQVYNSVEKC
jgi:hypothetical protein